MIFLLNKNIADIEQAELNASKYGYDALSLVKAHPINKVKDSMYTPLNIPPLIDILLILSLSSCFFHKIKEYMYVIIYIIFKVACIHTPLDIKIYVIILDEIIPYIKLDRLQYNIRYEYINVDIIISISNILIICNTFLLSLLYIIF